MNANATYFQASKGFRNQDVAGPEREKQNSFFGARRWETSCGDVFQADEAPDRWVFVVSLLVLPLVLIF